MPDLLCEICNKHFNVPTKDYKLLSDFAGKLCSADCLIKKIKTLEKTNNTYTLAEDDLPIGNWWSSEFSTVFRSRFEELTAKLLRQNDLNFFYEKYVFYIDDVPYTPDFYVPEHDCFLEVKGVWTLGKKKKLKKFVERYPTVNFLVVPWILNGDIDAATSIR